MPVGDLPVADVNPKKHELSAIKDSIKRFGFVSPIVMNEATGKLLAGHGRREATLILQAEGAEPPTRVVVDPVTGDWLVPVLRGIRFDNESDARAYLLADNRLTELGGWDTEALVGELRALAELDDPSALIGMGWDDKELAKLLEDQDRFEKGKPDIKSESEGNRFIEASVKQISFFYAADEYDTIVTGLDRLCSARGIENHSDLIKLLVSDEVAKLPELEVLVDEDEEGGA
jgi:hypothetical protein